MNSEDLIKIRNMCITEMILQTIIMAVIIIFQITLIIFITIFLAWSFLSIIFNSDYKLMLKIFGWKLFILE